MTKTTPSKQNVSRVDYTVLAGYCDQNSVTEDWVDVKVDTVPPEKIDTEAVLAKNVDGSVLVDGRKIKDLKESELFEDVEEIPLKKDTDCVDENNGVMSAKNDEYFQKQH